MLPDIIINTADQKESRACYILVRKMDSNQSYKINKISSKFYDALEIWMWTKGRLS